jgi:hypothetical protein
MSKKFMCDQEIGTQPVKKVLHDFTMGGDLYIFDDGSAAVVVGLSNKSIALTMKPYQVETYVNVKGRRTWA